MKIIIILATLSLFTFKADSQTNRDIGDEQGITRFAGKGGVGITDKRATPWLTFWDANTGEFTANNNYNFFDSLYFPNDSTLVYCKTDVENETRTCYTARFPRGAISVGDTNFIRNQYALIETKNFAADTGFVQKIRMGDRNANFKQRGVSIESVNVNELVVKSKAAALPNAYIRFDGTGTGGNDNGNGWQIYGNHESTITNSSVAWIINGRKASFHGVSLGGFTGNSHVYDTAIWYEGVPPKATSTATGESNFWKKTLLDENNRYIHTYGDYVHVSHDSTATVSPYNVSTRPYGDDIIYADAKNNNITINLPNVIHSALGGSGYSHNMRLTIKRIDSNATNTVTIVPATSGGAQKIDRYNSIRLDTNSCIVIVGERSTALTHPYLWKIINVYKSASFNGIAYNDTPREFIAAASFDWRWLSLALILGLGIGAGQKITSNLFSKHT